VTALQVDGWRPDAGVGWFTGGVTPAPRPRLSAPAGLSGAGRRSLALRAGPRPEELPATPLLAPGAVVCGHCPRWVPLAVEGAVAGRCSAGHRPGILSRLVARCGPAADEAAGAPAPVEGGAA